MFHRAIDVKFPGGTCLDVTFQDGLVKRYDMAKLFKKYPALRALQDPELFRTGKLMGAYGIMWNEDLDIETETIYEEGDTVGRVRGEIYEEIARSIREARAQVGLSQKQLSERTGIDQSDISKLERGLSNPSVATLERIAFALGGTLEVSIRLPEAV